MKQRIITAVIALLLFLPLLYFGGIALTLVTILLAWIGVYELFKMKGLYLKSFEGIISGLAATSLVFPFEKVFPKLFNLSSSFSFFYFFVMVLLAIQVISKNLYTIDEAAFPVIASLYVGMGFRFFLQARMKGLVVLLFGLLIVWATDIGAYMIGRKWGKHKLWPEISPNKTTEGALGGIISACIVSFLFLFVYSSRTYFHMSSPLLFLFTIFFSIAGQFGDLVESAMKRHYGVKDSGTILPGHGGILDRFDSMLFVFPIMHLFQLF